MLQPLGHILRDSRCHLKGDGPAARQVVPSGVRVPNPGYETGGSSLAPVRSHLRALLVDVTWQRCYDFVNLY